MRVRVRVRVSVRVRVRVGVTNRTRCQPRAHTQAAWVPHISHPKLPTATPRVTLGHLRVGSVEGEGGCLIEVKPAWVVLLDEVVQRDGDPWCHQ